MIDIDAPPEDTQPVVIEKDDLRKLIARLNVKQSFLAPSDIQLARRILASLNPTNPNASLEEIRFKAKLCAGFIMDDCTLGWEAATDAIMRFFASAIAKPEHDVLTPDELKVSVPELAQLLDRASYEYHKEVARDLKALRDRLGKDALSTDEWNALTSSVFEHSSEAHRRISYLPYKP